jgi:hypothetical protein
VKVVLLVNLPLDLALDAQANYVWIALARDSIGIRVDQSKSLLKRCHTLPRGLLLFLDVVLKIARKGLDLLDLLRKIRAEAAQLVDYIRLNVASFVCLDHGLLVEVAHDAIGIVEAAVDKERSWRIGVVDHVRDLEEALCAVLIRRGHFAEVGDEVLEELAPGCGMSVRVDAFCD